MITEDGRDWNTAGQRPAARAPRLVGWLGGNGALGRCSSHLNIEYADRLDDCTSAKPNA